MHMVDVIQPNNKNWGRKVQGRAKDTRREVVENQVFQASSNQILQTGGCEKGKERAGVTRPGKR